MSERALPDASDVTFPDDDLFDDAYLGDPDPVEEAASAPEEPPAPRPIDHVDGIDALAEPERTPYAAGPARVPQPGLRERIRSSRFGSVAVLLVTAALVAGGMWFVNGAKSGAASAPNGATAVKIPGTSTVPPPEVGKPAQDFTVTTIDGKKTSLSQFRGKAVWLVFGASWCAGCQAEVPDIEAAYTQYGPQGLVVLGVNITENTSAVSSYAKRVGITFPIGADPESAIADAYRVSAIPAHFFIDKAGVLREMRQGSASPDTIATSLKGLMTQ